MKKRVIACMIVLCLLLVGCTGMGKAIAGEMRPITAPAPQANGCCCDTATKTGYFSDQTICPGGLVFGVPAAGVSCNEFCSSLGDAPATTGAIIYYPER